MQTDYYGRHSQMFRAFRYVVDRLPAACCLLPSAFTGYVSLDTKLGERVTFAGSISDIRTEIRTGN